MKRRGWRSIPSQPRDRLAEFITATVESLDHGLVAPHQAFLGRGALPHRRGRGALPGSRAGSPWPPAAQAASPAAASSSRC